MKSKMSKPHRAKPVKAREPKNIKPPKPATPRKPKPASRTINSRTGALGSTSAY